MAHGLKAMKMDGPKASPPATVWLLHCKESDTFITPIDDGGAPTEVLAYFSRKDAQAGAAHQNRLYGVECEPFRVK